MRCGTAWGLGTGVAGGSTAGIAVVSASVWFSGVESGSFGGVGVLSDVSGSDFVSSFSDTWCSCLIHDSFENESLTVQGG